MNLDTTRATRVLFLLSFLVLGTAATAFAQGKISGRVTDAATGEPLYGVNVFIDGTQIGNTTNLDGEYVILNVRAGGYTLVFRYVGYATQRVENVRVVSDQTTEIDLALSEEVIEGEEVVVQAERPMVQRDLTASKKTVIAEEIEVLPVENFFGVLATQAGVTRGASGELHIRGGRSNEIAYMVDGMSVGNPFNTNGLATEVATNAIEELTVVSGAFNAEYGQAMSGIVNIVTKEGPEQYEGSFSAYAGDYLTGHNDIFMMPSGVDANVQTYSGYLGGPIPGTSKNGRFFLSGRYDTGDGHLYGVRQFSPSDSANFNPDPRRIDQIRAFLPDYDGPSIYYEIAGKPWYEYVANGEEPPSEVVPMQQRTSYNVTGKFSFRPFSGAKVEYTALLDGADRTPFNFDYRYNPDGVGSNRDYSYNHGLHWTHSLNPTTFYTLKLSYAANSFESFLYEDPTDPRYASTGRRIGVPGLNFLMGGNQRGHVYEDATSFRGKLDLTKQFGTTHEVKGGLDWRLHSLSRQNFTVLFDGNRYREPTVLPADESPSHDFYEDQRVTEISGYLQDKLEFENFIMNIGLRYDYFDPHGRYIADLLEPFVRDENGALTDEINTAKADPKHMFSPRLGVSFPITSRGIIHFSYGHFYQMPPLRSMYINPEYEFGVGSTPTFGNANLRPEFTVIYEIGLQQQLADLLAFDVTGYYKDIRDYLTVQRVQFRTASDPTYALMLNQDYANVRGIAFALTKRRARNGLLSATVDYTFQLAEGGNSDSGAFFFNFLSGRENEFEIIPLDFDQQHVLSGTISLTRPNSWAVSLIGQYATGYPYTPQIIEENIDLLPNNGRKPNQVKLDLNASKTFRFGDTRVTAFGKVFNLLDVLNERFVFDDTGRATYSLAEQRNLHAAWKSLYGYPGIQTLESYNTRPHYYSAPRQVRLGVTVQFGG